MGDNDWLLKCGPTASAVTNHWQSTPTPESAATNARGAPIAPRHSGMSVRTAPESWSGVQSGWPKISEPASCSPFSNCDSSSSPRAAQGPALPPHPGLTPSSCAPRSRYSAFPTPGASRRVPSTERHNMSPRGLLRLNVSAPGTGIVGTRAFGIQPIFRISYATGAH